MKTILCYGDSNTWGYIPGSREKRHPRNVRWTGVLQQLLGDDYYVIEEGLNGRTTCFDDPTWPGRNGYKTLYNTLESNYPIDLIVIMLGSNDAKHWLPGVPQACGEAMEQYAKMIRKGGYGPDGKEPEILLVAPLNILPCFTSPNFDKVGSIEFVKQLPYHYKRYAEALDLHFWDASPVTLPDEADGLHMNAEGHKAFAGAIQKVILDIIG